MSEKPTCNPLEQFVLLAKTARGAAAAKLIKQVLEAPGVYVFGELLDIPNIAELEGTPHAQHLHLLQLFANGTYSQYVEKKAELPELTLLQQQKLRHLTLVTLATKNKCIPYNTLLEELEMKNLRELEDLIIEAIYADIIHGKLDQKNGQLEIDYAIGRDIQPGDIGTIIGTLQNWCTTCEAMISCIETQITKANSEKERRSKHKTELEQEISNIKKNLKAQGAEAEESAGPDSREGQQGEKNVKKSLKTKGLRGSAKLWPKY